MERIQRNLLILRGLCGAALGFARFAPWEDSPPGQSAPLVLDNEGLWSCEVLVHHGRRIKEVFVGAGLCLRPEGWSTTLACPDTMSGCRGRHKGCVSQKNEPLAFCWDKVGGIPTRPLHSHEGFAYLRQSWRVLGSSLMRSKQTMLFCSIDQSATS